MEPNYDRFSRGVTPKIPDEVGDCAACGGTMYDYEVVKCGGCEKKIHDRCTETCDECGMDGCKSCLTETDDGRLLCENHAKESEIEAETKKPAQTDYDPHDIKWQGSEY